MPGTTFLPIAGPIGTAVGIALGGVAMLIIGMNYHYLMNRLPDNGGTYAYTKTAFGYDQGFLSAWFLIITYIAVLWANATALPLICRTLLGSTFQFGFEYEVAGFHVYMGEILISVAALLICAFLCLQRKVSEYVQVGAAVLLLGGVIVCFVAAMGGQTGVAPVFSPPLAPDNNGVSSIFTIFSLAPWAYVGFESISHSAAEARFSLTRTFRIIVEAVICAAVAYTLLTLLATTALPDGCASWPDYIANLGDYSGAASQPTFFAAFTHMGTAGSVILGIAALCGITTGLIGNYIALSRLLRALAQDEMLPGWLGQLDEQDAPRNAIVAIMLVSIFLPFFGRTAISWIVDVTTVGATIAYAFTSAAAYRMAKGDDNSLVKVTGAAGLAIAVLFALEFLVPNLLSVTTLSTESYLILAAWGIMGLGVFRVLLKRDTKRRLGRSTVAWIILLGLIIFTSTVWMRQSSSAALEVAFAQETIEEAREVFNADSFVQIGLIVLALYFLFDSYSLTQKRERQIEVEKVLAEESSRAKTSFLSNMSHEIRTPMNAIIGLDNIALRDPDISPRTREHLEKIGASAQHLLGLINDILDMSRIESGRMVLKDEEFSFREFLDQINIIINGQCVDKGLFYKCDIVGQVADYYCGDDMKLKQVLINILGNSVKFTEAPGKVTLTVEQVRAFEGMCTLRFVMADTGIGMDEEYIPKIFDAFSQEDATTTNRYGGSGLGMAITKNFVEMMNGEIHVQSAKGVGSVFTVTVTLKTSTRSASADQGIALPHNTRALVVDDDEIAREHARLVLDSLGIAADTAVDSTEALVLFRAACDQGTPYHLLLTDYKMPGMSGLELARAVRGLDGNRTAIIMLTGYNWDAAEGADETACIDAIMAKPLFADSLIRNVYTTLAQKEGIEVAVPEPASESEGDAAPVLAGRRVLMAEDVEQNAEILEDLLDLEEIIAEHAVNGDEAVKMFAQSPQGYYDAILMDVRMPVMDGLTATRTIRALDHPDAQTIPIIAMTANVFEEDVQNSLQAGMNAHLSKPIEPDYLYETMARLIAEH